MELRSSLPKANHECKEEKQREKSNMKNSRGHISSTFWSPFHAYYMSFQSLGSQESNALNGGQIGAEMKKLYPLEANRTKLKVNFAAAKSVFSCEMDTFMRNPPV